MCRRSMSFVTVAAGVVYLAAGLASGTAEARILMAALGVALVAAGRDPVRHWSVGLAALAAALGLAIVRPDAWSFALAAASAPQLFVLRQACWSARCSDDVVRGASIGPLTDAVSAFQTEDGCSVRKILERSPVLLVFLRHTGCTFCRQTLATLAEVRDRLDAEGAQLMLVHHSKPDSVRSLIEQHRLRHVHTVCDARRLLYRHFGLGHGRVLQLLGPSVMAAGFRAMFHGHGVGKADGDALQMPGVFLCLGDHVLAYHYHRHAAEQPDYVAIARTGIANLRDS